MAHLELIYLLKMVFFHSYVSLPEGSCLDCLVSPKTHILFDGGFHDEPHGFFEADGLTPPYLWGWTWTQWHQSTDHQPGIAAPLCWLDTCVLEI